MWNTTFLELNTQLFEHFHPDPELILNDSTLSCIAVYQHHMDISKKKKKRSNRSIKKASILFKLFEVLTAPFSVLHVKRHHLSSSCSCSWTCRSGHQTVLTGASPASCSIWSVTHYLLAFKTPMNASLLIPSWAFSLLLCLWQITQSTLHLQPCSPDRFSTGLEHVDATSSICAC